MAKNTQLSSDQPETQFTVTAHAITDQFGYARYRGDTFLVDLSKTAFQSSIDYLLNNNAVYKSTTEELGKSKVVVADTVASSPSYATELANRDNAIDVLKQNLNDQSQEIVRLRALLGANLVGQDTPTPTEPITSA